MKIYQATCLIVTFESLALAYPIIVEHEDVPNSQIQIHDDPAHPLHPRDSITINIQSSFTNTTVSNHQNEAIIEVITNTNSMNRNVLVDDHSNHESDVSCIGNQNMLDFTGNNKLDMDANINDKIVIGDHSNKVPSADGHTLDAGNMVNSTGTNGDFSDTQVLNNTISRKQKREQKAVIPEEANAKDEDTYRNLGPKQTKDGYRFEGYVPRDGGRKLENAADCGPFSYSYLAEQCVSAPRKVSSSEKNHSSESTLNKRDEVNLNLTSLNSKASNVTQSGNGNTVEVFIGGGGDGVVNVDVHSDLENSQMLNSNNNNVVKIYVGGRVQNGTSSPTAPPTGEA